MHPDRKTNAMLLQWIPAERRRYWGMPRKRWREDLDEFEKDWIDFASNMRR